MVKFNLVLCIWRSENDGIQKILIQLFLNIGWDSPFSIITEFSLENASERLKWQSYLWWISLTISVHFSLLWDWIDWKFLIGDKVIFHCHYRLYLNWWYSSNYVCNFYKSFLLPFSAALRQNITLFYEIHQAFSVGTHAAGVNPIKVRHT